MPNASRLPSSTPAAAVEPHSKATTGKDRSDLAHQKLVYTPLESHEIRLLRIIPRRSNSENYLECSLEAVSLNQKPRYEALSYVWGDPSARFPIVVNGKLVQVTISLFQALRSLRDSTRRRPARHVWADAICINQENIEERSEQIAMMQHIYTNADCVVVWLGESTLDQYFLDRREAFMRDSAGLSAKTFNSLEELQALLGHPWWQRVWVIQELVCAKRVILSCGKSWMQWYKLVDLCRSVAAKRASRKQTDRLYGWIDTKLVDKFELFRTGIGMKELLTPLTPLDSLCIFAGAQSTDSRDQVYGLLGVIALYNSRQFPQDIVYQSFPADYSISEIEMYKRLAHHHIAQAQNLLVLYFAQGIARTEGLKRGPSWLPDMWLWKKRVLKYSNEVAWRTLRQYHATGSSSAMTENVVDDDSILKVAGKIIHRIARKGARRGPKYQEWRAKGSKRVAREEWERLRADDIVCLLSGSGLPFVLRKVTLAKAIGPLSSGQSNNTRDYYTIVGPCIIERGSDGKLYLTFELLGENGYRALESDNDYMNGKFWAESVDKAILQEFLLI